nr:TetR/AcrR family transcriptional regulator [Nocardia sp. XZ_19_369]
MPRKRVDARTERWREHRLKVREEFVDAAFRALDKFGPEVSMGDIAKEAGAAKPKLYRHFEDKTDLYNAIVDRVRDMLWEQLMSSVDLTNDSARELVRRGAAEYALVVSQHPNVFRFMLHSHFAQQSDDSERALQSARQSAKRAADLFAELVADTAVEVDSVELVIYSIFGAVGSATDWWLGANRLKAQPMPIEKFVAYLAETIAALTEANARLNGIVIDTDLPLHLAFSGE